MVAARDGAGSTRPIFIHSSWRAGSTYVWSKFRHQPGTYCYFEPLNEHLPTVTQDFIDQFRPWISANHPPLRAPYLEEFRPLVRAEGGIAGFPTPLVYGQYCADHQSELPGLAGYLNDLAAHAAGLGRRPVYGFVRTDLRVGWFRARMDGINIFVRREPRRQFLSMMRQATTQNPYFLDRGIVILLTNFEAPVFAPLRAAIDVAGLVKSRELREVLLGRMEHEAILRQLYIIFSFMRRLSGPWGEAHSDLVIDIDRLSLDLAYRAEIEDRLGDLVGMAISFADCTVERYETALRASNGFFDALERETEGLEILVP